jgi:hypothetical protein
LGFRKSRIFFRKGLDRQEDGQGSDLPVGSNQAWSSADRLTSSFIVDISVIGTATMVIIQSKFIGDFVIGDNIVQNLKVLELLYEQFDNANAVNIVTNTWSEASLQQLSEEIGARLPGLKEILNGCCVIVVWWHIPLVPVLPFEPGKPIAPLESRILG